MRSSYNQIPFTKWEIRHICTNMHYTENITVFETSSEVVKLLERKLLPVNPPTVDLKAPTHIVGHANPGHANSYSVTACMVQISVHSRVNYLVNKSSPWVYPGFQSSAFIVPNHMSEEVTQGRQKALKGALFIWYCMHLGCSNLLKRNSWKPHDQYLW